MNEWFWLELSIALLLGIILIGNIVRKMQKSKKLPVYGILIVGFAAATLVWCFGALYPEGGKLVDGINGLLLAVQSTFRIFAMDFDYDFFSELIDSDDLVVKNAYAIYTSFLLAVAPILTLGVILSFFNEVIAFFKILFSCRRRFFVFSELNAESLEIAKSCIQEGKNNNQKVLIIFTDVYKESEESLTEMMQEAQAMDAICVKKDILSINYFIGWKKALCEFFILGKNENENVKHTLALVKKYYDYSNVKVYLFSECKVEKILINAMIHPDMKMKVRCINLKQNLIYNYLYKNNLYSYVSQPKNYGEQQSLSVGIAGDGTYTKELIKALLWYGQIPEYDLQIHVFDESGMMEEEFRNECPELMKKNNIYEEGEAKYSLNFYPFGPGTDAYREALETMKSLTLLYMMYEREEKKNIRFGIESDRILKRKDIENETKVICLICDMAKKEILQRENAQADKIYLKDHKGNPYNLEFLYQELSYQYIFESELEEKALDEHLKWSSISTREKDTEDFYNFDYFYRSSVARVIRVNLRRNLYTAGMEKKYEERTSEEKRKIRETEHAGWNAYMRTEGYCYGRERNEMLRIHPDLVPFDLLSEKEKSKDDD